MRNESDRRNCKETAVKNFGRNGDQTNNRQDQRDTVQYDRAVCFGSVFLDLFAGSGGIGIEALSRGAKEAVFVEKNPKAMACVKENLKYTKLSEKAMTMTKDVLTALYQLEGEKVFDFVFMDPPYDQDLERQVLAYLSGSELIYEDTVIIVEASKHTDFSYLEDLGFTLIKEKEYKTNKHVFIEKAGKEMIC